MANIISITLPLLEMFGPSLHATLPFYSWNVEMIGGAGGKIDVVLPKPVDLFTGSTGNMGDIAITLGWPYLQDGNGKLDVNMYGGGSINITLPLPTDPISFSGTIGNIYSLDLVLPLVTSLINSQYNNIIGSIDVDLPLPTMTSVWYPQIIGHISGAIPLLNYNGTGLVGQVGTITGDLTLLEYAGTLYSSGVGSMAVSLPVIIYDTYGTSSPATLSYKAIIMNTKNFGVSEYPDYNINSMVSYKGKLYGASGSTIRLLGSQYDNGEDIDMSLSTGNLTFDQPVVMLPRDMWITLRSGKQVKVFVLENEKTDDDEYEYVSEDFLQNMRDTRVKLGRGLRSGAVRFRIENIDGEDIDIERIHILSSRLYGRKR